MYFMVKVKGAWPFDCSFVCSLPFSVKRVQATFIKHTYHSLIDLRHFESLKSNENVFNYMSKWPLLSSNSSCGERTSHVSIYHVNPQLVRRYHPQPPVPFVLNTTGMSDDIKAPGFKVRLLRLPGYLVANVRGQASELIAGLQSAFSNYSEAEKQAQIKKVLVQLPPP